MTWLVFNYKMLLQFHQSKFIPRHIIFIALAVTASFSFSAPAQTQNGLLKSSEDVRTVRRPAQVYFGAYRNMDQLVAPDAKWDFVKANMDGFIMHFGFWLNNDFKGDPIGVGKKLSAQLNPLGKKWMMEVGWPGGGMEDHFADMGKWYGEKHAAQIQKFERETGIVTNEISCDFRLFGMQRVAAKFPAYTAADVYQQVTGDAPNYPADGPVKAPYWPAYMRAMNRELPEAKIHVTFPPVYVPWDEFSGAGKNFNFTSPRNGTMKFKGRDFMTSLFKENLTGFIADSPFNMMMNPKYAAQGYLEKELSLQTWLHGRGAQFSHIINGKPDAKLAPDAWDAKYKEMSLQSLYKFQAAGGRADRYIFESWHIGPYKIAPETQEGTYTNLVMDAIKYLKGTDQKLDLSVATPGGLTVGAGIYQTQPAQTQNIATKAMTTKAMTTKAMTTKAMTTKAMTTKAMTTGPLSYEVKLQNNGEVACMPTLRALDGANDSIRYSVAGRDVTDSVRSVEGHVFTTMLAPGQSVVVSVTLAPGAKTTQLQAFWNPQDAGTVRDAVSISAASK